MNIPYTFSILTAWLMLNMAACGSSQQAGYAEDETFSTENVPVFNADSAYHYVKYQVDFGPRVPNTEAHQACGDYLIKQLEKFGAKLYVQQASVSSYDGKLLNARNIIGAFNPESKKRVALFSHWDSRPWADNDPDPQKHFTPILGANDGASGVGVLMEVARQLQQQAPSIGIDIIFFDAEDYGTHRDYNGEHKEEHWCLGSQYWARNPHIQGYSARYGILLDMVGGKDATFKYEYYSEMYAKDVNRKVWRTADKLGFGRYFKKQDGGGATDDHLFVNKLAHIPTIDIIATSDQYSFFEHWHTVRDDMDAIDRQTLQAVGQTLLQVIYSEK
ncbi:MAG: M28 family peptidase [Bacteroidaceae bacterium]|nr:M28 family peptidase [Bacteroidaceae bacterium]